MQQTRKRKCFAIAIYKATQTQKHGQKEQYATSFHGTDIVLEGYNQLNENSRDAYDIDQKMASSKNRLTPQIHPKEAVFTHYDSATITAHGYIEE